MNTVSKQHFTYLYKPARDKAITKRNILARWAAARLFPFNPERVLRDMPKPPTEQSSSKATVAATSSQNEVPLTPVTPVTPVTVEALTSLHSLIKQDICAAEFDDADKQRLKRRVGKLESAAKISFAKQSLLQDHNRLLYRINNEAKVRRSTRSLVVGTAKVMKYEDLTRVREERAATAKAAADKAKGKRGRKRKASEREADGAVEDEAKGNGDAQEADSSVSAVEGKRVKRTRVQGPGPEPERRPWRAPVAPMYPGAA